MKTQDILIAHPSTDEELSALKAFMKALKIKFEVSKQTESPYDPDFVAKIEKSKKEFEDGNFTRVAKNDLQSLLGI